MSRSDAVMKIRDIEFESLTIFTASVRVCEFAREEERVWEQMIHDFSRL